MNPSPKSVQRTTRSAAAKVPFVLLACPIAAMIATTACQRPLHNLGDLASPDWLPDYNAGEQAFIQRGDPMLILFREGEKRIDKNLLKLVHSEDVLDRTEPYVRFMLHRDDEPDRRYAEQFGLTRAPALVVVHPDRTFHVRRGKFTKQQLFDFLDSAEPPGTPYRLDPLIPRQARYRWMNSIDDARDLAAELDRPIFAVITNAWARENRDVKNLVERYAVFTRTGSMVPFRINVRSLGDENVETPWGELQTPAFVIEFPGGEAKTLERPTGYEHLVRFLDDAVLERKSAKRIAPAVDESAAKETSTK